jgi:hypothetical protein
MSIEKERSGTLACTRPAQQQVAAIPIDLLAGIIKGVFETQRRQMFQQIFCKASFVKRWAAYGNHFHK